MIFTETGIYGVFVLRQLIKNSLRVLYVNFVRQRHVCPLGIGRGIIRKSQSFFISLIDEVKASRSSRQFSNNPLNERSDGPYESPRKTLVRELLYLIYILVYNLNWTIKIFCHAIKVEAGNLENMTIDRLLEFYIKEAAESDAPKKVKVSITELVNIIRRNRESFYDESKRDLKERKIREVLKRILDKFPLRAKMSQVKEILCKVERAYRKWHFSHYKDREETRSAIIARFMAKDLCLQAKMIAKDYETLTPSAIKKIIDGVYKALKHHASLWEPRKKKNNNKKK